MGPSSIRAHQQRCSYCRNEHLEAELGEEPTVGALGVTLLESLLDGLLGVLTLGRLLEGVGADGTLERLELEDVTGGEEVSVVDDLDEGLDLAALGELLLAHRLGDLQGVTEVLEICLDCRKRLRGRGANLPGHTSCVDQCRRAVLPVATLTDPRVSSVAHSPLNAGNDGVGVRTLLGSLVALLDNNNLLASLTSSEDDSDLSGLHTTT